MEELQSTEALDKEILEDARKKAYKILKSADDSINSSKSSWDKKFSKRADALRKSFAQKTETFRKEIMARLSLDKKRVRIEVINGFINNAMDRFLDSLDRSSILGILKRELALHKGENLEGEGKVLYRSLSPDECSSLVTAVFPGAAFTYHQDPLHTIPGSLSALVIELPHLRMCASVNTAARETLLDKRAELTSSLLGNIEDITFNSGTPIMNSMLGAAPENSILLEKNSHGGTAARRMVK